MAKLTQEQFIDLLNQDEWKFKTRSTLLTPNIVLDYSPEDGEKIVTGTDINMATCKTSTAHLNGEILKITYTEAVLHIQRATQTILTHRPIIAGEHGRLISLLTMTRVTS